MGKKNCKTRDLLSQPRCLARVVKAVFHSSKGDHENPCLTELISPSCRQAVRAVCSPDWPVWPCLTQVAKVCWKFLFCWNVTGVPILVARTTLVPGVTWLVREPTMTLVVVGVEGLPVVALVLPALPPPFWSSRRFCGQPPNPVSQPHAKEHAQRKEIMQKIERAPKPQGEGRAFT